MHIFAFFHNTTNHFLGKGFTWLVSTREVDYKPYLKLTYTFESHPGTSLVFNFAKCAIHIAHIHINASNFNIHFELWFLCTSRLIDKVKENKFVLATFF